MTRFDAFSVTLGDRWFQIHANRTTQESAAGAHMTVVNQVSEELGVVKPTEVADGPAGDGAADEPNGPDVDVAPEEPDEPPV